MKKKFYTLAIYTVPYYSDDPPQKKHGLTVRGWHPVFPFPFGCAMKLDPVCWGVVSRGNEPWACLEGMNLVLGILVWWIGILVYSSYS